MASIWDWLGNRADITFNGTRAVDEKRRREEEAERQRLIEAQRLADLEAQQQTYVEDAYADELYRRDRANTGAAIELGRQNMVSDMTQPSRIVTEQPSRYVDDRAGRLRESDPILVVEDEVVDTTPSPMSYVLTGESYSDPREPEASIPNDSNAFWDFLGLADKEDRKRWSNGMLRAGGAILAGNDPDVWRNLGRGINAYGEAGDSYDKAAQERALGQQRIDAGKRTLDEADRKKAIQAEISSIIQAAGPDGLNVAQRQRVAALQAELGDYTAANSILGNTTGDTASIKEYQYAVKNGFKGTYVDWETRKSKGVGSTDLQRNLDRINEERLASGKPAMTMEDYQAEQNRVASDTKFAEEAGKNNASMFKTLTEDGLNARTDLANIEVLDTALKETPGGFTNLVIQGANNWGLGDMVSNNASSVQVASAMIDKLVPLQRPAGSGAASDADMRLFKGSLPQLQGTPEGNQLIVASMRGLANYKQQLGQIAAQAQAGRISQSDALAQMQALPDPLEEFKRWNKEQSTRKGNSNGTLGGPVLNPNSSNLPAHLRKRG